MAFIEPMHRNKPNITYLLTQMPIFYITTSAITETTVKQHSFAFICSGLTLSDQPYFSVVVNTRVI